LRLASERASTLAVTGLTLVALALRWPYFHQSLFGDELFLYLDVHGRSLGQVLSAVHDTEKTPPLGFLLAWVFAHGGDATVLVRLPSLMASLATVPLLYLLGQRTLGRPAGLVAAAWFALSPFAIFYGSEARAYALVTALVVLSSWALVGALQEHRRSWWALYAVAMAAALYTHYIALLVLLPQAAWALWTHRDSARRQLLSAGAALLLLAPWLPSFLVQARHSGGEARRLALLAPLTVSSFFKTSALALVGHPFEPLRDVPGRAPLVVVFALLAGTALAVAYGSWRRVGLKKPNLAAPGTLLVLLAVAPVLALTLYSLRPHTSFFVARNLSVAVPYALVLFGWLLTHPRRRGAAALLALTALACVAVGTVRALSVDRQRPNARGVAHFIEKHGPSGAAVVDVEYPFTGPPSQAVRVYASRPSRIDAPSPSSPDVWGAAVRTGEPVFVVTRRIGALMRLFVPPSRYAGRFRLVASHTTSGFIQYVVREYAPR
jgi:Dolichyl-phosphate-mannose-protein mannosyltransferase